MRNWKIAVLSALTAGAVFALPGCGVVDENFLDTEANYTVDISVPYATATPLPEYLNVPDPIVIDSDGNVTLNDASIIEGDFQSARNEEEQTEYRSLTLGSNGIAVQALQSRLQELGYFDGEITGLFDVDTEASVKRFEQTYGTMQTGVATQKLQLRLFSSTAPAYGSAAYNEAVVSQYTVLRPGTVGSSVYALQQRLKNLDYPIIDLTGAYDDQTALCVRLFYQTYGITPSDVADVNMQRQLYAEDALHYDKSMQPLPTDTPVTWSSNKTELATVSSKGQVTGKKATAKGEYVTITAKFNDPAGGSHTLTAKVTVTKNPYPKTMQVTGGALALRKAPNGTLIKFVKDGTKVTVTGLHATNKAWAKVTVGGQSGYMMLKFLKNDSSSSTDTEKPTPNVSMKVIKGNRLENVDELSC